MSDFWAGVILGILVVPVGLGLLWLLDRAISPPTAWRCLACDASFNGWARGQTGTPLLSWAQFRLHRLTPRHRYLVPYWKKLRAGREMDAIRNDYDLRRKSGEDL